MKPLYKFFLASAILFIAYRSYLYVTDDFRISHITFDHENRPEWAVGQNDLSFLESHPYTYLAKGAQTYVFKSADGKYVIKFFKFKHVKPAWWDTEKQKNRKARKIERLFKGYLLAYNKNRDLSGLIYLHLNKGTHSLGHLRVVDKIGFARTIDLDQVAFIVQKTGETLSAVLKQDNNQEQFNSHIGQLIALYKEEYDKGLYDRDHRVMDNFGFADGKAIHLDIGMLSDEAAIKDMETQYRDLEKALYTIHRWVEEKAPRYLEGSTIFMQDKVWKMYNRPLTFDKSYEEVLKHHP